MNGLFLACFTVLLAGAYAQINVSGCGKRPLPPATGKREEDKVLGGVISTPGDWGWQISMLYYGSHICGGSVVNNQWIVTAAHCVSGDENRPTIYTLDLGVHDRTVKESWVQSIQVSKIITHPQYSSSKLSNDVALMKLSRAATLDGTYVIPVCVLTSDGNLPNQKSHATGWGSTSSGGALSRYLREVDLRFTTNAECTSYYSTSYDAVTMVCAGDVGDGKDTCQGDSGGPLVWKDPADGLWYLVGLTSWGYGCGDIGVYTRVSTYTQWIITNINNN